MSSRSINRRRAALAARLVAATAGVFSVNLSLAADTTYIGPAAGNWDTAANWNNGVPTSGNRTFVDNGVPGSVVVTIPSSVTRATGTLTISAGDAVAISDNSFLNLNGNGVDAVLNSAGAVSVNAGGNATRLQFIGTGLGTFTGGGTINLISTSFVNTTSATARIVNDNMTIRGVGTLAGQFTNSARVVADVNGGLLNLTPSAGAGAFANTGTFLATGGGVLVLSGGGLLNNTAGTFEARDNSAIRLNFASINGGTFITSGTGSIRVNTSSSGLFSNFTNLGLMVAQDNSDFDVSGTILNNGTISIESGGNPTDFELQADTTLNGSGQLILTAANSRVNAITGRLTNTAAHTIRGRGSLGLGLTDITNNGLIAADISGGALTVQPRAVAGSVFNNNVMRATGGGILTFSGGSVVENASGTIEAQTGSTVRLANLAAIAGGTYLTSGTGSIRANASANTFLSNFTNLGLMVAEDNSDFGVSGNILNNGTISLESQGNPTDFEIQSDTTLNGTGQLILTGANPGVNAITGRLINTAAHTIRGRGLLGQAVTDVTNNGLIAADVSTATLTIAPRAVAGSVVNNGVMRATGGGILVFAGTADGTVDNTNGTIEAQNGSTVQLNNLANIAGGTYSTGGTGNIRTNFSANVLLSNFTNLGLMVGLDNSDLGVSGNVANNGTISLESQGNPTDLEIQGDVNLIGTGQIVMSGANPGINGVAAAVLTHFDDHTIRGRGALLQGAIKLNNRGRVIADVNGATLTVQGASGSDGVTNVGTFTATNGSTLVFSGASGGAIANGGGLIEAQDGSTVRFISGASVTSGTFATAGTGSVRVNSSQDVFFTNITNNGLMVGQDNSDFGVTSSLVNNGTVSIESGGNPTDIEIQNEVVFAGGGHVRLVGTNPGISGFGQLLFNTATHTIGGRGNIGRNTIAMINQGTIVADIAATTLTLDPLPTGAFQNDAGTFAARNGATLAFSGAGGGTFSGTGVTEADATSTILATSAAVADIAIVRGAGAVQITGSSNFTATHFRIGTLTASSGTARIRSGGGANGTSRFNAISTSSSGKFDITDSAAVVDYTTTTPFASIRAQLIAGYGGGTWNGATGIISSTAGLGLSPTTAVGYAEASDVLGAAGGSFAGQTVDNTTVLIRYTLAGDANLDLSVNLDDFTRLAAGFATGSTWGTGDFNYNGQVTLDDFTALAANFGRTLTSDLPRASAVPEPVSVISVALLLAGAMNRPRRRRA